MSEKVKTAYLEIAITSLISVIAGAIIWTSLDLPESVREPLGSATIPQVVCSLVILFCIILITRATKVVSRERARTGVTKQTAPPEFRKRFDFAVYVFLLAVVYVGLMQTRLIPSLILTPVFLGSAILVLNEFRRASIIPAIAIALAIGLGINFLFTNFFYIDLP